MGYRDPENASARFFLKSIRWVGAVHTILSIVHRYLLI